MKALATVLLAVLQCACVCGVWSAEADSLDPHLEAFRPLLGKTFRGEFKNSTPEKPIVDVLTWERALNGKAIRTLHSINDGQYGGETLYVWDAEENLVKYFYFTTAGFRTVGSVKFEDGKFIASEKVHGSAGGITEVKGIGHVQPDGTLKVQVDHLKGGEWVSARETLYKPAPGAKVIFK